MPLMSWWRPTIISLGGDGTLLSRPDTRAHGTFFRGDMAASASAGATEVLQVELPRLLAGDYETERRLMAAADVPATADRWECSTV